MYELHDLIASFGLPPGGGDAVHRFFRLSAAEDADAFRHLLSETPGIVVCDELTLQLKDLVKLRHPESKLTEEAYQRLTAAHLGGVHPDEYGVWVYYPWRKTVVHLLDEAEFTEVRTIRNRYKITAAEQSALAGKKIGVIGLSVGQSVSLALALERVAGEIRIADFDHLELGNLNRIRAGVHHLGVRKTAVVAREIAEIDPFLKVTCFEQGIDKDNIDDFLLSDGGIDLLVEECDDVAVKILARQHCRRHGIPVLMDTSDRGMIDVERFDLDRNLPLLHGKISEDISYDFLRSLQTSEDKLPYITPFSGVESLSTRMKASAMEVGQTITTWPQLASDVILGGAVVCNLARRLLLGVPLESQRKWIDLDEIFGIRQADGASGKLEPRLSREAVEKIGHLLGGRQPLSPLPHALLEKLVGQATLAPSPGNTQRWKWVHKDGRVYVLLDKTVNDSVGDNGGVASMLGIGAALENFSIAAAVEGFQIQISVMEPRDMPVVAEISLVPGHVASAEERARAAAIPKRSTNRGVGDESGFDPAALAALSLPFEASSVDITFTTDQAALDRLGALVREADRVRMMNKQAHYEFFFHELKSASDPDVREGLLLEELNLTELDKVGLRISRSWEAIDFLRDLGKGKAFTRMSKVPLAHSSALGIVSVPEVTPARVVSAGMAMERMWLDAVRHGLGIQPMTYLMVLVYALKLKQTAYFSDEEKNQIDQLGRALEDGGFYPKGQYPVFLFRVHSAPPPQTTSRRLPTADTLVYL